MHPLPVSFDPAKNRILSTRDPAPGHALLHPDASQASDAHHTPLVSQARKAQPIRAAGLLRPQPSHPVAPAPFQCPAAPRVASRMPPDMRITTPLHAAPRSLLPSPRRMSSSVASHARPASSPPSAQPARGSPRHHQFPATLVAANTLTAQPAAGNERCGHW